MNAASKTMSPLVPSKDAGGVAHSAQAGAVPVHMLEVASARVCSRVSEVLPCIKCVGVYDGDDVSHVT